MENPRREKPQVEEKDNPLYQKLVQNGRVSSCYDINPSESAFSIIHIDV